jgi:hypothetical protein
VIRAKSDQWCTWAVGQVMGISETCVVSLQHMYSNDWGHYMAGPSCWVLGEFLSFQHRNNSMALESIAHLP